MSQVTYYFNSYNNGEAWQAYGSYMVNGSLADAALTWNAGQVQALTGNTCPGTDLGYISKVELRSHVYSNNGSPEQDIILRPVFSGATDGNDYPSGFVLDDPGDWTSYIDITADANAPAVWAWTDVEDLECDVQNGAATANVNCSKVEIRITYGVAPPVWSPADLPGLKLWLRADVDGDCI